MRLLKLRKFLVSVNLIGYKKEHTVQSSLVSGVTKLPLFKKTKGPRPLRAPKRPLAIKIPLLFYCKADIVAMIK